VKANASKSGRPARDDGSADLELELAINELAADQAAVRIVLQSFLLRLLAVRADTAPAAFAELQEHVSMSIEAIPLAAENQLGSARWRKLVANSAERLLGEIGDTLDASVGEQVRWKARRYPSSSG